MCAIRHYSQWVWLRNCIGIGWWSQLTTKMPTQTWNYDLILNCSNSEEKHSVVLNGFYDPSKHLRRWLSWAGTERNETTSTHARTIVVATHLGGITRSIWFSYLDSKSGRVEKGLIVSASPGDISHRVFAFIPTHIANDQQKTKVVFFSLEKKALIPWEY